MIQRMGRLLRPGRQCLHLKGELLPFITKLVSDPCACIGLLEEGHW